MLWLGKSEVQVTWEPESKIPREIIEEFEKGLKVETIQNNISSYGLESSTVVTSASAVVSPTKKARLEETRVVLEGNTGCVDLAGYKLYSCRT